VAAGLAGLAGLVGCAGSPENVALSAPERPKPAQVGSAKAAPSPAPDDEDAQALIAQVKSMLDRVARVRGLPIRREVPIRILDRPAMLARIREQAAKDLPPEMLVNQGEALSAFGLVPPDFDFVAGMFRLIEGQIAGFYVPEDGTMYLADDLSEAEAEETLAHELVHALQDQSYGLAQMIKVAEGDGDRVTAAHALVEGDAMSAMLDVSVGSAFAVSEGALRRLLTLSTSMSAVGATSPRVLTSSLTAPYADGFGFVQGLRRRGGWKAVDAAYGAKLMADQVTKHGRLCSWCMTTTAGAAVAIGPALQEGRAGWRALRG